MLPTHYDAIETLKNINCAETSSKLPTHYDAIETAGGSSICVIQLRLPTHYDAIETVYRKRSLFFLVKVTNPL